MPAGGIFKDIKLKMKGPFIAIVDYGLGNLFSIREACRKVGLEAIITSSGDQILESCAIILTGVGAFGKAMAMLDDMGLVEVLRKASASSKPLLGICLGMQLLMSESYEFGHHLGLDIIQGRVIRLNVSTEDSRALKVPQVGWNSIAPLDDYHSKDNWKGSLLEGVSKGAQMYFVHSYFVEPLDKKVILCTTRYGTNFFCSGLQLGNITGFQFHPECSGPQGLKIYSNLAKQLFQKGEEYAARKT